MDKSAVADRLPMLGGAGLLIACNVSKGTLQHAGYFCSGCGTLWTQRAVLIAAEQATANRPFNRLFRPVADAGGVGVVGEVAAGGDVEAFILRVIAQDGSHLLAGDGGVWLEAAIVKAVDHADAGCPVDGLGVSVAVGHVGEVTSAGRWAAFQAMEHGHEHGAAEAGVRLKGRC